MSLIPFTRRRDGVHLSLGEHERALLRDLSGQIVVLLEEGDPADPAVARLLPPAYEGDDEANEEFRRLTVDDLTAGKIENATALRESLDTIDKKVPLSPATEQAWLRGLNDIRLTLASRLGVTADGFEPTADPERRMLQQVYEWLGYLQETLVRALDRGVAR